MECADDCSSTSSSALSICCTVSVGCLTLQIAGPHHLRAERSGEPWLDAYEEGRIVSAQSSPGESRRSPSLLSFQFPLRPLFLCVSRVCSSVFQELCTKKPAG